MVPRTHPDWSLRLLRPLQNPNVMKLVTLADVRELLESICRRIAGKRIRGGTSPPNLRRRQEAATSRIALRPVLMLERVQCQPM